MPEEFIGRSRIEDILLRAKDNADRSFVTIDITHHQIHEGKHYSITKSESSVSSISFSFKTGGDCAHMIYLFSSVSASYIQIKEGVSITATTGTQLNIINRNRNSSNQSCLLDNKSGSFGANDKILQDATTSGGTVIHTDEVFGATPTGKGYREENEFLLKQDTEYEIILTSSGAAQNLHLKIDWYEV